MTTDAARLEAALDNLLDQTERATHWLGELEDERAAAQRRVDELRRAILELLPLLPPEARLDRCERLIAVSPGAGMAANRPGPPVAPADRLVNLTKV